MFTFVVYCEGPKLWKCLEALEGLALKIDTPRSVINLSIKDGKMLATHNGTLLSEFKAQLKKDKTAIVTPTLLKAFVTKNGRAEKSYSNLLREAKAEHVLKKARKSGGTTKSAYEVNTGALNA